MLAEILLCLMVLVIVVYSSNSEGNTPLFLAFIFITCVSVLVMTMRGVSL